MCNLVRSADNFLAGRIRVESSTDLDSRCLVGQDFAARGLLEATASLRTAFACLDSEIDADAASLATIASGSTRVEAFEVEQFAQSASPEDLVGIVHLI